MRALIVGSFGAERENKRFCDYGATDS